MFVAGTQDFGSIDHYQQTCVSTRFFHVWFVPIWPLDSVVKSSLCAPFVIPRVARSIAVAYLRLWAPLLLAGIVLEAIAGKIPTAVAVPTATVAAVLGLAGWVMGRLGRRGYAERQAYRHGIGVPVDPALLADSARRDARARILDGLGREHGDYRHATSVEWRRLTMDPNLGAQTLHALVTLARIEETLSAGVERTAMRATRRRLVDILLSRITA